LIVTRATEPHPGPEEVVIDVHAAGVNFADCVTRMGLYQAAKHYATWPITPGFEIAGRIRARGELVEDMPPGTRVMAVTRFGGYASRIAVPRCHAFEIPGAMSFAEAAGFPVIFLTAHHALFRLATPRPGDLVLIHSAAGGVGGALVQLARAAGCVVVAVVGGPHKVEVAHRFGAAEVIDRSCSDMWASARRHAPEGYQAVFDANGPSTFNSSYEQLAPLGRLIVYGAHAMVANRNGKPAWLKLAWHYYRTPGFDPFRMANENRSVMAFNLAYLFEQHEMIATSMRQLLAFYAEGKLRPPPITEFPLDRVAEAHRALESGQTVGKLVLVM
jgi:NADPH:quinone reductase-like Zn-dependent oxidoreductase